jgi:hypothetical protein
VCRQTCQYLPFAKNFEPTQILLVSGLAWFIYIYQRKEKAKQIKTKQVAPSITKSKSNGKSIEKAIEKSEVTNKSKNKSKKVSCNMHLQSLFY